MKENTRKLVPRHIVEGLLGPAKWFCFAMESSPPIVFEGWKLVVHPCGQGHTRTLYRTTGGKIVAVDAILFDAAMALRASADLLDRIRTEHKESLR